MSAFDEAGRALSCGQATARSSLHVLVERADLLKKQRRNSEDGRIDEEVANEAIARRIQRIRRH
jgi:hypothetical protein